MGILPLLYGCNVENSNQLLYQNIECPLMVKVYPYVPSLIDSQKFNDYSWYLEYIFEKHVFPYA